MSLPPAYARETLSHKSLPSAFPRYGVERVRFPDKVMGMAAIRKLTENFIATEVGEEILLIDLDGGELFSLSGTARAIWDAIDGQRDARAIAAILAPCFDATAQEIERDASDLVRALEDARLVEKID